MEDFEAETLKCTFFFFHLCCVPICSFWRLSSFIQSGYSTDPKLSNRTWAIRGSLLLLWTFLLFQTSFSLKNKKTQIVSKLISSPCASAVISSPVWRKQTSRKPLVTFDLRQNTCSCCRGAKWTVSCSCSKQECLETQWAAVCWPDDQTLLAVFVFVITF